MIRIFGHYIPQSILILGAVETLLNILAVFIGTFLYFEESYSLVDLFPKAVIFSLVLLVIMIGFGLYQRGLRASKIGLLLRLGLSALITLIVMAMIFYAIPELFIYRGAFAYILLVCAALLAISRLVFYNLVYNTALQRRILVFGTGDAAKRITLLRRKSDWQGSTVVGFVKMEGEETIIDQDKVIGDQSQLVSLIKNYDVDELIVTTPYEMDNFPSNEIIECKLQGVSVIDVMTFFERQTGRIKVDVSHPERMLYLDGFCDSLIRHAIKRVFDLVVSSVVLFLASPIILLGALAVWLESMGKHPVIYRQVRVGKDGTHFTVYKFRSMIPDAEKNGAQWAQKNDSRVTKVGNFLRKTRIDELPQLFNVFAGDMSFVGPRPERPEFVKELKEQIPFYNMRQRVKPGITGWAQICYPYGASLDDSRSKLEYDLYYIKNYSLFLDLTVLVQTAQVVVFGTGAR